MRSDELMAEASFDPKLKLYLILSVVGVMMLTIVGIPLIPLALPFAAWWAARYYERLACILTARSVVVRKGVLIRKEMTIPLDRIQDLSTRDGPLLRWLGLSILRIETAGHSAPAGKSEADLIGIVDARGFRDRVLELRDRVVGLLEEGAPAGVRSEWSARRSVAKASDGADGQRAIESLLEEIRDTLRQIQIELSARP